MSFIAISLKRSGLLTIRDDGSHINATPEGQDFNGLTGYC